MKKLRKILFILLIVTSLSFYAGHKLFAQKLFEYTMVNVNIDTQGDAHLVELPNGVVALIDAGYSSQAEKSLAPLLIRKNIKSIDYLFISHAHRDHYEGAFSILKAGINIKRLMVHRPPGLESICQADCCCVYSSFNELTQILPTVVLTVGQKINLSENVWIKIIDLWKDGDSMTDINDTSVIMKLETSNYSILFAGDLNKRRSKRLVGNQTIKADILKMPHHGVESMAVSEFYETVNADVFLAPCPKNIWLSERANRSRQIADENNIETFVNGIHETVTFMGYSDRYKISGTGKYFESERISSVKNILPKIMLLLE